MNYIIKKLNKWQSKIASSNMKRLTETYHTTHKWCRKLENAYRNYYRWYDKLSFKNRPVIFERAKRKRMEKFNIQGECYSIEIICKVIK